MAEEENKNNVDNKNLRQQLISAVSFKKRRLKSREEGREAGTASALALFGMVGWSISVPLVLFIIIGQFSIKKFGLDSSSLVNFIFIGLAVGIFNTYKEFKKTINKGMKKYKKEFD